MMGSMRGYVRSLFRGQKFLPSRFAAIYHPDYLIRRGLYKHIASVASGLEGDILDLGCGSKPYRQLFGKCDSYIGVDVEISGHDHADSSIDVFYDGVTLPFQDRTFDAVLSFEVLEHVFEIETVLKEVRRVLKPGGTLFVTLPFAWPEHEQPYDFARYTSFGMRHLLAKYGFDVISIKKSNSTVRALHQMWIEYISENIFSRLGSSGKILRIPFVCAINAAAVVLDAVLPASDDYYSNLIVDARRPSSSSGGIA